MSTEADNRALVLEAFDTLFNKRDYKAAETFWSPLYIQHSAHIAPGREGLFSLVKSLPAELRYENAVAVAQNDYVLLHGRFVDSLEVKGVRSRVIHRPFLGRHPQVAQFVVDPVEETAHPFRLFGVSCLVLI